MEFKGFYKNDKTGELSPYPFWKDLFRWPKGNVHVSFGRSPKQELILSEEEFEQMGLDPKKINYASINGAKIVIRKKKEVK